MHQAPAGGSEGGRAPFAGFGVPQSIGRVGGDEITQRGHLNGGGTGLVGE